MPLGALALKKHTRTHRWNLKPGRASRRGWGGLLAGFRALPFLNSSVCHENHCRYLCSSLSFRLWSFKYSFN